MSMSDGGLDLRGRFLFDTSGAKSALDAVSSAATAGADKIIEEYRRAFDFTKNAIGIVGLGVALSTAVDSASQLEQSQAIQAQLLTNQGVASQFNLSMTQQQYDAARKSGDYTAAYYSKMLANQATYLSVQTGINREQITQAQTLAYTNTDIAKLVSAGPMVQGALSAAGQPLHNMRQNMQLFMTDAANLSKVMAGGHGSINSSARMLTRTLQDPMHHMSAMSRYGFTLSQSEQMRIRNVEMTNGLYAAQKQMLVDINNHVQNVAQEGTSPIELLKNDLQIIYTTLGSALLPLFKNLAGSLSTVLTALSPMLQSFGDALGQIMNNIGGFLAPLMQIVQPIFDLLVNGILPAFFAMIQPIIQLVNAVAVPIVKALTAVIEPMNKNGALTKVFVDLGKAMGTVFKPLIGVVQKLADSGIINTIFGAFVQILQTLEPIIPMLAGALVKMAIALLPVVTALITPAFVKVLQAWADVMVILAPYFVAAANGLSTLIKWITGNKGLTEAIAMLLAFWFTRKLFIAPIGLVAETLTGLIGRFARVATAAKNTGGVIKDAFSLNNQRDAEGNKMKTSFTQSLGVGLENRAQKMEESRLRRMEVYKERAEKGGMLSARWEKRAKRLEENKSFLEREYAKHGKSLEMDVAKDAKGTKFGRLLKGVLGLGLPGLGQASDNAKDPVTATNNLVDAINNLIATIQSSSMGGGGNNLEKKLEGKLENKVKSEIESKAKNEIGKKLEGELGKKLESKIGGRLVGAAKNFLGRGAAEEGGEALLAEGGGEAAAEGGILAAGAASGVATLGVGLAVAAATVAYMKWHKQINHALMSTAHHLENGAKDVAKWGAKTAKDAAKHFVNIGKHLLHGAGALVKGAAHIGGSILHSIGGFFGGLFGGGGGGNSGSKAANDSMAHIAQLKKMTFTDGALNVHIERVHHEAARALARGERRERGGETVVNIEKGAFVIEVKGNLDKGVSKQVEKYVEDQFNELHRRLRTVGR